MRSVTGYSCRAAIALGLAAMGASAALAQSPEARAPIIEEVRLGLLAHSVEPSNSEDGVDINAEVLFRRARFTYNNAWLDLILRPRVHLGASVNTVGDTSQLYAGLTWDVKLAKKLTLEVSFGGTLHDGPTGGGQADSYGCALNFRESASIGYALDDRWTIYGTVAHMSNAQLCDQNTGLTSVGVRLGYKLQ